MESSILNIKTWKETGKIKLNEKIWSTELNEDLVTQALSVYRANQRKANPVAKTRADVSGGGRKPWRQKGTGRARAGSSRSPLWVKGGVVFGPTGEDNHSRKLNKKMKRKAFAGLLSHKLAEKEVVFVEMPEDVKEVRNVIVNDSSHGSVLVVSEVEGAYKALRNVKKANCIKPEMINIYEILNADAVLVDSKSLDKLEEALKYE